MKKSFTLLVGSLVAIPSVQSAPASVEEVMEQCIQQSVPHLMAAIELSKVGQSGDKNFIHLAKAAAAVGIGQAPAIPKRLLMKAKNADDHQKEEMQERIAVMAQGDIKFLKSLDKNGDLQTDTAEVSHALRAHLEFKLNDKLNVDSNGDKKLSLTEYALSVPSRSDEKDKDGFDWHQKEHFKQEDKNGDGYIDQFEILASVTNGVQKRALLLHAALKVRGADANNDGALSKAEFMAKFADSAELWGKLAEGAESLPVNKIYPSMYWFQSPELNHLAQ